MAFINITICIAFEILICPLNGNPCRQQRRNTLIHPKTREIPMTTSTLFATRIFILNTDLWAKCTPLAASNGIAMPSHSLPATQATVTAGDRKWACTATRQSWEKFDFMRMTSNFQKWLPMGVKHYLGLFIVIIRGTKFSNDVIERDGQQSRWRCACSLKVIFWLPYYANGAVLIFFNCLILMHSGGISTNV